MERLALAIEGMSCADCVRAVSEALEGVPGARVERVDIGMAWVAFDPARATADDLGRAVEAAGYRVARAAEVR